MADDRNRLAVYERVLRGLRESDVLAHPPKDDRELGDVAEAVADNVTSGIELSRKPNVLLIATHARQRSRL